MLYKLFPLIQTANQSFLYKLDTNQKLVWYWTPPAASPTIFEKEKKTNNAFLRLVHFQKNDFDIIIL